MYERIVYMIHNKAIDNIVYNLYFSFVAQNLIEVIERSANMELI